MRILASNDDFSLLVWTGPMLASTVAIVVLAGIWCFNVLYSHNFCEAVGLQSWFLHTTPPWHGPGQLGIVMHDRGFSGVCSRHLS